MISDYLGISNILLLLLSAFCIVLILILLIKQGRNKAVIFFSSIVTCLISWILAIFFSNISSKSNQLLLWTRMAFVGPSFFGILFLYFTIVFPKENYKVSPFIKSSLLILSFIFLYLSFTPLIIENAFFDTEGRTIYQYGKLYSMFFLYLVSAFFYSFFILIKKYRSSKDSIEKLQIKYLFIGLFLSAFLGILTNLLLPMAGHSEFGKFGPLSVVFLFSFTTYAILKHHLMNVKVITTEIFSILVSLVLLVNALLSESLNEFILNFILFLAISFFSVMLIRSVLKEVKIREELAALTEKLQKANLDLQKLDKAKSEFISIASHQLRTPLSIIKGFVSMLLEGTYGALPEKAQGILAKIEASNDRLNRLINDLLDLSRMEGGRMKFEWEFIPLTDLVQSVIDELKPQAEKKKLELRWDPYTEKIYVRADKEKLRQVIMNLIDNAIKYTQKGYVEVKLEKMDGGLARLAIKDTGIGMSQDELGLIFGKFVRGKKVPRLWTEGVGLGLYVAKKILEEHKGRIWAKSQGEEKGSTFYVELPAY